MSGAGAGGTGVDPYLAERVRTALAEDPRVGELGVDVVVDGARLVLTGVVGTAERCAAVEQVARELAPEHDVDNRLTVVTLTATGDAETVA